MPKLATAELVALTWLRSLADVTVMADVATDVPDVSSWRSGCFVRVQNLGGSLDSAVPLRDAIFRISFLAKPKESTSQPPWNVANVLAETMITVTYGEQAFGTLVLPSQYNDVRLCGVEALSLPSRVTGSPQSLARYDVDLSIPYIEEN